MNQEKIQQFRKEFQSIVGLDGLIKTHANHLRGLYHYDRNGSHQKAIERGLVKRDELKTELNIKLKGRTYEEWKQTSKRLSLLNSRLKNAIAQKERAEQSLSDVEFIL